MATERQMIRVLHTAASIRVVVIRGHYTMRLILPINALHRRHEIRMNIIESPTAGLDANIVRINVLMRIRRIRHLQRLLPTSVSLVLSLHLTLLAALHHSRRRTVQHAETMSNHHQHVLRRLSVHSVQ